MEAKYLMTLSRRVANKFRHRPEGVTYSDCVQDVVVLLLQLEPQAEARRPAHVPLEAWLVERAYFDLLTDYGRRYKRDNQIAAAPPPSYVQDDPVPKMQITQDVRDAVDKLEEKQREVMLLWLEDMTQAEIAKVLGTSQPYVSKNYIKAVAALKESLSAYAEQYHE